MFTQNEQQSDGTKVQSDGLFVKPRVDMSKPDDGSKERKAFGQRLLRARLEMGARLTPARAVSQTEIGEAVGVTGVAVGSWEAGRKEPNRGTIAKLSTVLGVRAAWLAFGEEPMRLDEERGPRGNQRRA